MVDDEAEDRHPLVDRVHDVELGHGGEGLERERGQSVPDRQVERPQLRLAGPWTPAPRGLSRPRPLLPSTLLSFVNRDLDERDGLRDECGVFGVFEGEVDD